MSAGKHFWAMANPVTIPDDVWDDTEGTGERLHTRLNVNGVSLHVEAFRVVKDAEGVQQYDGEPAIEAMFSELSNGAGGDGPFETAEMRGAEYVIFAFPYC